MPTSPDGAPRGGLRAEISNAIVQVVRDYTGRGPTRARAYLDGDLVTVLLQDTLTTGEKTLAESGQAEFVLDLRQKFQQSMREDCVIRIEELTGRSVRAFMSANSLEPDIAAEMFVLEPEPAAEAPT
jgi:uncharacterized protein YbcI